RFAEAVTAYEEAIRRAAAVGMPERWSLFYDHGVALERSGQWQRAEQDLKHALELKPEQPLVLNYLGYSWIDRGENLDEGLKMIEKAVELRPDDGYIVDSLGWAHYRMGDYAGAVEQLEKAVELVPQDPTINDHLGDAYWQSGRLSETRYQCPLPLIARFRQAAALPIGVTQMVVDRRILRHQLDRFFELFDRPGIIAHPVMRPAQAVDDVAVIGAQLDRLFDHLQ